eukprot:s414_g6.t1
MPRVMGAEGSWDRQQRNRPRIHFAGDWKVGVGHNDAIKAGIAAACRAGIHADLSSGVPAERQLYKNLLLMLGSGGFTRRSCPRHVEIMKKA